MKKISMRFDRLEMAGSLGDLGTLLPLGLGMVVINGLPASGLFLAIGVFYILAGLYFGVPSPVQPMKVIGAYAVATAVAPGQITAAGLLMAAMLLVIGATGLIGVVSRLIPRGAIRGVQVATGAVLMAQGARLVAGTSSFQQVAGLVEPQLAVQALGPVPVGLILGLVFFVVTFALLDSKRYPAGLVVVLGGFAAGLALGGGHLLESVSPGLYLPELLPFGMPTASDFALALVVMVLPQTPMTLGNAVMANADLSQQYFGDHSGRVTPRSLCISMGLANLGSALVGGMPLCHGAGGLAAHYRFGARTAGSNVMIGTLFIAAALFLGPHAVAVANLMPLSVLGVLLVFAGGQLGLALLDVTERKELFVALLVLGVSLGSNLAWGFGVGVVVAHMLRVEFFRV